MLLRPSLLPALAVFAVAARHQNFAQAAQELHLTASAVSHHVRRLEEVLETRLFLRHARGVRLTAEGRQLADAASAAFADVAAVAHHLQPDADSVPLRITTLRSLSYCWLLPRLPRFARARPHLRIGLPPGGGRGRGRCAGGWNAPRSAAPARRSTSISRTLPMRARRPSPRCART